jgi:hypothetical protein
MIRRFIQTNVAFTAILLFMIVFTSIQLAKPAILYNLDGSIRSFGVGYRNKTILPIWLLSIFIGILSYISVMYYITYF